TPGRPRARARGAESVPRRWTARIPTLPRRPAAPGPRARAIAGPRPSAAASVRPSSLRSTRHRKPGLRPAEQIEHPLPGLRTAEGIGDARRPEEPRHAGERLEMRGGRFDRGNDGDDQVDRSAVGGAEV